MAALKYRDPVSGNWVLLSVGVGLPAGGALNNVLRKKTASDFDTEWHGTFANPLASAPAIGSEGDTYYNTVTDQLFLSDGTNWNQAGGALEGDVNLMVADRTYTSTPLPILYVPVGRTITTNYVSNVFPTLLRDQSTKVYAQTPPNNSYFGVDLQPTIKGNVDFAVGLARFGAGFHDRPVIQADTGIGKNLGLYNSFRAAPTITRVNAGTFGGGVLVLNTTAPIVQAGVTLDNVNHYVIVDAANTGVITQQIGFNIPFLAAGVQNIGFQNASTMVLVPVAKTITVVGDTIPNTGPSVTLNNTSGSSKTLNSAPTIANGVDGQELLIINIGASDVVIQDQGTLANSNLRLAAATRTLSTRDSIRLRFDATINDWHELNFANVL